MTLKIVRSAKDGLVVFTLSGRIELEHVAELQHLVDFATAKHRVVLNLKELRLVDREAVQLLARCEAEGVELDNCPAQLTKERRRWCSWTTKAASACTVMR
jgi:anti-anti-sigma regulatory factor